MATNRAIDTRFWDDNYISSISRDEMLIFLYLLQNQNTSWCGVYEIQPAKIAMHTKTDVDFVLKTLHKFEQDDKVLYRNGWVAIKNFLTYKKSDLGIPNVRKAVKTALEKSPLEMAVWMDWSWLDDIPNNSPISKEFKGYGRVMEELPNSEGRVTASTFTFTPTLTPTPNGSFSSNEEKAKKVFAVDSKKTKKTTKVSKRDDSELIVLSDEITKLEESSRRDMHIIAHYLDVRRPKLENYGQLKQAIKRHLRPASSLVAFNNEQIIRACKQAEQLTPQWTLETVLKVLTK